MSTAQMHWVNHASYILEDGGVRLLVDPWLFGTAFDDGWALLSKTKFDVEDFNTITHIWFSHEHPDHFSPPVLSAIKAEVREKITVLFQQTRDHRVANFCRKLGFQVKELAARERLELSPTFSVQCGPVRPLDSWLLAQVGDTKILNINDCVIGGERECRSLARTTGTVDVLLTQFSYANWISNKDEREARIAAAREKFDRIQLQAQVLKPRVIVPFASMVYFCHAENHAQNDGINRIDSAFDFIKASTEAEPVVMYPGDTWRLDGNFDSGEALHRYAIDYERALGSEQWQRASDSVPLDRLHKLAAAYCKRMHDSFSDFALRLCSRTPISRLHACSVHITDLDTVLSFSVENGLTSSALPSGEADIAMHSACFSYVLAHDWGLGTLLVNGRFVATAQGRRQFASAFRFGNLRSAGRELNFRSLSGAVYVCEQAIIARLGKKPTLATEDEFSMHAKWQSLVQGRQRH